MEGDASRWEVMFRMEQVCLQVVSSLAEGTGRPSVFMHRRSLENTVEIDGVLHLCGQLVRRDFVRSPVGFARYFAVLALLYQQILTGRGIAQRGVFYQLIHLFDRQVEVNNVILDLSATLECPRHALTVTSSFRGVLAGNIIMNLPGADLDVDANLAGPEGIPIPASVQDVYDLNVVLNVEVILVIEKFGIFQRLVEECFHLSHRVLLLCGCGYPSFSTRALVARLGADFEVPIACLTDHNPHGLAIFQTYRRGSVRAGLESSDYGT
mmetsp:Transcript_16301/g.33102  ORF Transcript_16301/g.33102 Transcript_16301/m.33102 type:complete len:267 (-) Transcript_16301:1681-2481(-)